MYGARIDSVFLQDVDAQIETDTHTDITRSDNDQHEQIRDYTVQLVALLVAW